MSTTTSKSDSKAIAARNKARFLAVFPSIVDELVESLKIEGMPTEVTDWYKTSLEYNTPGGKLNRGISVVDTIEILRGSLLEGEEYRKAAILGWAVELLQAYFLVADDMMDASITRRAQPCWYRVPKVGNIAINDSFMLEAAIYHLLKVHFRKEKYYVDLLEIFLEVTYKTEMGQLVDLITAPEDDIDLNKFSLERHRLTVVYKTAYYSFYLPVALAMHFQGITDPAQFSLAQHILVPLGEYFQVQDDFLDAFAPPEVLGKVGTDIVDGKNSWPVNIALNKLNESSNAELRKVLDDNYGKKDAKCEAKIKELFKTLGVEEEYKKYEKAAYERIVSLVQSVPAQGGELKREVFMVFLEKIFGRTM